MAIPCVLYNIKSRVIKCAANTNYVIQRNHRKCKANHTWPNLKCYTQHTKDNYSYK